MLHMHGRAAYGREDRIMGFENLTDEQKAKAMACKTPEEMLALAKEEGYELTDEELEGVAGGWDLPCNCDAEGCGAYTGGQD